MPTAPDLVIPAAPPSNTPAAPGNATGTGAVAAPTAPVAIQAGGAPAAPTAPGNATGSGSVSAPTAPKAIQAWGQPAAPDAPDAIQSGGQPDAPTAPDRTFGAYGDYVQYLDITGEIGPFSGGTVIIPRLFETGTWNGMPRWAPPVPPVPQGEFFIQTGWECIYDGTLWMIRKFGLVSGTDPTWWSEPTSAESPAQADWTTSASEARYSAGIPLLSTDYLQRTAPTAIQAGGQPAPPAAPTPVQA